MTENELEQALKQLLEAKHTEPDSLWVSAIKGRLLAVMAGLTVVITSGSSLWTRISAVMADNSLSAEEAVSLLNAAGPLLEASTDMIVLVSGVVVIVGAAWSKWRESKRRAAVKQSLTQ